MSQSQFSYAGSNPPAFSETEKITSIQLIRSRRVGPTTFHRLLAEHGNAENALAALPDVARSAGVKTYSVYPRTEAEKEYEAGRRANAKLLCWGESGYPELLARLPDAPPVLWVRGKIPEHEMISVVGARNASSLGTRMTKLLSAELGQQGFAVVSGLARGIDTAAHLATLASGTVAVMAGGVDFIYPRENQELAEKIVEKGALISEQPIGLAPQARHFPQRNRLISGLSRAVVVVEAAAKSGSLITAREALDQGREVMAVPGHPLDARASGCNILIRDGAVLVRSAGDIIEALDAMTSKETDIAPALNQSVEAIPPMKDSLDLSRRILSLLSPTPIPEDQLIRELELPAGTVTGHLVTMELEGKLARQSGGMLSLVV